MTLRMGDSITVANIPVGLEAYAGYVNGHWPTYPGLIVAHPNARHLSIAVTSAAQADVLDVETGDANPADVPGWLARWKPSNTQYPVIYCNMSTVPAVLAAAPNRRQYLLWTAHYTDQPHICNGPGWYADGTQWTNHGGVWDESLLTDTFFPERKSVARKPLPEPVVSVSSAWGQNGASSQLDVFMVGRSGKVYHDWYNPGSGWMGPEVLSDAG